MNQSKSDGQGYRSETEELFYRLREKLQGNVEWNELNAFHQYEFVSAVNTILNICSAKRG